MSTEFPAINGRRLSHASLEAKLAGALYTGFKSLNFDDSLTPGRVGGTHPVKEGATIGEYDANCNYEMLKQHAAVLRKALAALADDGLSYGTVLFDLFASYVENGDVHTIEVRQCRIMKIEDGSSQGPDGMTEKHTLFLTQPILRDGLPLIAAAQR